MHLPKFVLTVFFGLNFSFAQQIWLPQGAESFASAGASVALSNAFAVQNNPAAVNHCKTWSLGISQNLPFLEPNLATSSVALIRNYKSFYALAGISQFGYRLFNQQRFQIGVAKKLNEQLIVGSTINYFTTNVAEQHYFGTFTGDVGCLFTPVEKLKIGVIVTNITRAKIIGLTEQTLPSFLRAGGRLKVSDEFYCMFDYQVANHFGSSYHYAIGYTPYKSVVFHAGVSPNPGQLAFGSTLTYKNINLIFAVAYNQSIGITPATSLLFNQ